MRIPVSVQMKCRYEEKLAAETIASVLGEYRVELIEIAEAKGAEFSVRSAVGLTMLCDYADEAQVRIAIQEMRRIWRMFPRENTQSRFLSAREGLEEVLRVLAQYLAAVRRHRRQREVSCPIS